MDNSDPGGAIFGVLFMGGLLALLGYGAWWRNKYRPPYITDENGERQRVIKWSHGIPVYNPKTWKQRVHEEVLLRTERRKALLGVALVLGPLIGFGVWLRDQNEFWSNMVFALAAAALIPTLGQWLPPLIEELRYQFGDESMDGAPVTDKAPKSQPGREVVEAQKAHGDAQLASEAEAVALLSSNKK